MGKNILQTTNKRVRPLWLCPLIKKIFTLFIWLLLLPVTVLAADEHDSHSNNWTEFTAGTTTLSGGSYYLSGDVEYTGTESITVSGEVILCLNDHKLDLKGQHISVGSGASLTLCDCSTGGVLTGGSGALPATPPTPAAGCMWTKAAPSLWKTAASTTTRPPQVEVEG